MANAIYQSLWSPVARGCSRALSGSGPLLDWVHCCRELAIKRNGADRPPAGCLAFFTCGRLARPPETLAAMPAMPAAIMAKFIGNSDMARE